MNLYEIEGYGAYNSDGYSRHLIGYFRDGNVARQEAIAHGWGGEDKGIVEDVFLWTDGTYLYDVKNLGKFTDIEKEYKEKTIASIKSKLTESELELLGLTIKS